MEADSKKISYAIVDTFSVKREMPDFRPDMDSDDIFEHSPASRAMYDEIFLPALETIREIVSRIPRDILPPEDPSLHELETRFSEDCAPKQTFADLCRGLTGEDLMVAHIFAVDSKPQPDVVGYLNATFGSSDTFPGFPPFKGVGGFFAYAYVDPNVRRQGIFTGLMERGEKFMTKCTDHARSGKAINYPPGSGGLFRPNPKGRICRVMFNMHPQQRDFKSLKEFYMARGYEPTGNYTATNFSTPCMPELEFFAKDLECPFRPVSVQTPAFFDLKFEPTEGV